MCRTVASMLVVGMIGLTFTQEASAGRRAWRRQACCYYYTAPAMVQTAQVAPAYSAPAPAAAPAPVDLAPAPPVALPPDAPARSTTARTAPAPVIAQTGGTGTTYRSYSYDSAPAYRAPVQVQNEQYNYGVPAASSVPNLFRADRKMYGISRMPSYR